MLKWIFRQLGVSDLLSSPTQGYGDSGVAGHRTSQFFNWEDRPVFTMTTAELMEYDPKVTIALAIRNGMLKQGQVKITGHPEIKKFVRAQWDKLWNEHGSQIARTKIYGHAGFEVLYRQKEQLVEVSGLRDFHPRDCRPLVAEGKIVGVSVRNVKRSDGSSTVAGKEVIWAPKALWLTFKARNNAKFGESLLEHAYAPWWEKWMRGGAVKMRNLRMQKDAWIGDIIRYPTNKVLKLPNGEVVSYRDMARELVELRQSGGVMGIPSDVDVNGKPLFDYTPPTHIDGATMMFDYIKQLDDEIVEGCEVAKEIVQAADTGSGFSGRSIPFIGTLSVLQEEFDGYVRDIDRMVIGPAVRINFGPDAVYSLKPESLILTVGRLMGGEDDGGGSGSPAQAMGGPPGGFSNGNLPTGTDSGSSYGQTESLSDGGSRTHVYIRGRRLGDRLTPRVAPAGGAVVGGVYYRPGVWVDSAALQFASDEELTWLDAADVLESLPPPPPAPKHDYSCLMAPAVPAADAVGRLQTLLPIDEVQEFETDPHITVLYGIESDQPFDVERVLFGLGPIAVRLGGLMVFEKDDCDVLVAEVESAGLVSVHDEVAAAVPHVSSYPTYTPHLTVAYVTKGLGSDLVVEFGDRLRGVAWVVDQLRFADRMGVETFLPLDGPAQFADSKKKINIADASAQLELIGWRIVGGLPYDLAAKQARYQVRNLKTGNLRAMTSDEIFGMLRGSQFADDGKWITIGGREADGKKHAGGFAVQIDSQGRILKGGPAGLQGKKLSEVGDYFDSTRESRKKAFDDVADYFTAAKAEVESAKAAAKKSKKDPKAAKAPTEADAPGATKSYARIVAYQADKWGMDAATYESFSNELFEALASNEKTKENARIQLRERLNIRIPRIAQMERQGLDYSHVKGIDTAALSIAREMPDLGWSEDDPDLDRKAWELLKEGQVRVSKVSPEFHQAVDDYLEGELRRAGESYNADMPDLDSSQFSEGVL